MFPASEDFMKAAVVYRQEELKKSYHRNDDGQSLTSRVRAKLHRSHPRHHTKSGNQASPASLPR